MSLKSYPKVFFKTLDFNPNEITNNHEFWQKWRGFVPLKPLSQDNYLVVELYSEDNEFITYQTRDVLDNEVETKYKLQRFIKELIVKTDNLDLAGDRVLCESTMDTLLLRTKGVNAWCTLGLKTSRIRRLLKDIKGYSFLYLLHNDPAGHHADKSFRNFGLRVSVPFMYKDLNEWYLKEPISCNDWIEELKNLTLLRGNND